MSDFAKRLITASKIEGGSGGKFNSPLDTFDPDAYGGLADLSGSDLYIWVTKLEQDPKTCLALLDILESLRFRDTPSYRRAKVPGPALLTKIQKLFPSRTHSYLYRGTEDEERGVFKSKELTYWTPEKNFAREYAHDGGTLMKARIPKKSILFDATAWPFIFNPFGHRSADVIVLPGAYKISTEG